MKAVRRFIKDVSGLNDSKERIGGTISSCIYSMLQGVQILRVHDVNEINQGIKTFNDILPGGRIAYRYKSAPFYFATNINTYIGKCKKTSGQVINSICPESK